MSDELLKAQVNALIRDEIQEGINEYVDAQEETQKTGVGFVQNTDEELKVNIPNKEVDRIIKEYKKLKRKEKSNFSQIKKLGLLDKHGRPL
jgi:hypothetical protein